MPGQVCVDASLALMLYLPDPLSVQAEGVWQSWLQDGVEVAAPPLFFAEVTSVLRASVYFGRLGPEDGEAAFSAFMHLPVQALNPPDLQPRAWALARQYNRPRAYDAQYLAVAESLGCDLWTGDRRLANAVRVPWLRLLGA